MVISVGTYLRFSLPISCDAMAVDNASTMLVTQMTHFDDVYVSATNGTRNSIDYPVTVMQQILMSTQEIEVPVCMGAAKDELIHYMRNVIRAFHAFKIGEPDTTVKGFLDESYDHIHIFFAELDTVKKCAPYCFR